MTVTPEEIASVAMSEGYSNRNQIADLERRVSDLERTVLMLLARGGNLGEVWLPRATEREKE